MQAAANAALRVWSKDPGAAAYVAGLGGAFACHSKDLLHIVAPDVLRGNMQPKFSELLFRLKQPHSDRTEISRSAFHNRDPPGPNPDIHVRMVALGAAFGQKQPCGDTGRGQARREEPWVPEKILVSCALGPLRGRGRKEPPSRAGRQPLEQRAAARGRRSVPGTLTAAPVATAGCWRTGIQRRQAERVFSIAESDVGVDGLPVGRGLEVELVRQICSAHRQVAHRSLGLRMDTARMTDS